MLRKKTDYDKDLAKGFKDKEKDFPNFYRHTLFTPLYATRGSFGPGNI